MKKNNEKWKESKSKMAPKTIKNLIFCNIIYQCVYSIYSNNKYITQHFILYDNKVTLALIIQEKVQ